MPSEETAKTVASLLGTVTSPGKILLVGFIVVVATGAIKVTLLEFILVGAACFAAQVFHDDWLRIVLNIKAERTRTK